MKRLVIGCLMVVVLGGVGLAVLGGLGYAYLRVRAGWQKPIAERYRTKPVTRGDIQAMVTSTGTVQPVQSVQVGAFVSGPILKVNVDFNSRIKAGDVMAEIDPRTYKAAVARERASLAHAEANVERNKALLEQAERNEQRALKLRAAKKTFISETEVDQYTAERKSLAAQLKLAEAAVLQAQAGLETAETNIEFTVIKSPVDGLVIDRKVDSGQTVAASFQTPTMFLVSPDLDKRVYVYASVDEADIGQIRDAERRQQTVLFSVDAYPDDVFQGKIYQIRLNPTTLQNVVTYTVVVEASNKDLKLLPGMTANLTFQIEQHKEILRVASAALRFQPKADQVRVEDRALVERKAEESEDDARSPVRNARAPLVDGPAGAAAAKPRKVVWVIDGQFLTAVDIETGLNDNQYTEILSGGLTEGQEVVIGPAIAGAAAPPPSH